jgi:hypothetical protein
MMSYVRLRKSDFKTIFKLLSSGALDDGDLDYFFEYCKLDEDFMELLLEKHVSGEISSCYYMWEYQKFSEKFLIKHLEEISNERGLRFNKNVPPEVTERVLAMRALLKS